MSNHARTTSFWHVWCHTSSRTHFRLALLRARSVRHPSFTSSPSKRMSAQEDQLKSGVEERELAFSGLHDRCIEKSIGEYKYKICASGPVGLERALEDKDVWEGYGTI